MKKMKNLITFGLIFTGVLFVSCGGSGTKTESESATEESISAGQNLAFGKLAGMVADYTEKISQKEDEVKKNTDMDKAFKLAKELELLREDADKSMSDFVKGLSSPLTIPVVQEGNQDLYKITAVSVKEFYGTQKLARILLTADIELVKAEQTGMINIQLFAGDSPTGKWLLLNPPAKTTGYPAAGQTYEYSGPLYPPYIIGVTKLVAKTKEDYKAEKH